ncbi:hypothetical protein INS49_006589 [Diaporthe citri]|uniref:uncharacterized protein n=1 Tax=Diaporthe citri TaxID=83186 RepID=UPI001C80DBE6|nr:uncharacterized protein INS49_006589 [Diaporthe citri]KAG6364984.1 hypothetical protein INS49_006589 [Diaporthe citri]
MGSFLSGLHRNWVILNPPVVPKEKHALRFGILGAANIAPTAFITPAKSHPEVVVYAVAARDKTRATAFAAKHYIPLVLDSYDEILDNDEIDAVYIPLPIRLHYEWALKALAKGKHVLLEKSATSNASDTERLFRHPILTQPSNNQDRPVLLEAFHNRFTPAWQLFQSTIDPPNVAHVLATAAVPSFVVGDDDIRFNFQLGGGALLDLGTYPVAGLRASFAAEPTACIEASMEVMPPPRERCDHTFHARFSFPNGGVGEIRGTMRAPNTRLGLPTITVTHRPVAVPAAEAGEEEGAQVIKTRKVIFWNFMFSPHYHRVDVVDTFEVRRAPTEAVRTFERTEHKKAYTFREMDVDQPGGVHWSTYRHMLEQFVHKVRGRDGTGTWVSPEDSIAQARAMDMIYIKSGVGTRDPSAYKDESI